MQKKIGKTGKNIIKVIWKTITKLITAEGTRCLKVSSTRVRTILGANINMQLWTPKKSYWCNIQCKIMN